jgi:hypothetical protein
LLDPNPNINKIRIWIRTPHFNSTAWQIKAHAFTVPKLFFVVLITLTVLLLLKRKLLNNAPYARRIRIRNTDPYPNQMAINEYRYRVRSPLPIFMKLDSVPKKVAATGEDG